MIRNTDYRPAARRIAVIQVARPQRARMGSIATAGDPYRSWTTISDATPDSVDNFQAMTMTRQTRSRQTTPGTLVYTPASDHAAPNVAPWNSWLQPNCFTPAQTAAAAAAAAQTQGNKGLWWIVGVLTAAASATYLYRSASEKGRH
jgi:hypothetical protein